jgi:hypothetical protein
MHIQNVWVSTKSGLSVWMLAQCEPLSLNLEQGVTVTVELSIRVFSLLDCFQP